MAAPVLQGVVPFISAGTSVSIPASAASPINGDYRLMVVQTSDKASNGAPVSVATPTGWTLLYQSPRGRSAIRMWLFGQVWSSSTPTATLSLSANLSYSVTVGRVSGYTLTGALITTPATGFGSGASLTAGQLNCQADSLRLDIWTGYFAANANSVSTVINVPAGQVGSPIARPTTTTGYVTRVTSETRATKGYTGMRTATMSNAGVSAVLSLAIGGWKVSSGGTISTMGLTRASTGRKAVTRATTTTLAPASTSAGGRATSGDTHTDLAVTSTSRRVHLTRTTLALGSTSVVQRTSLAETVTALTLTPSIVGFHVTGGDTSTELKLTATAAARIGGGGASPSVVDQYTVQYQPSTKPLRFMFQRIRDGHWLNWDVPLVDVEITYTLSGPTLIRGKIGPEDGWAVEGIEAWGTWVHVEEGGVIRGSAILQPLSIQDDDLMIEAMGPHGYAVGMQFESEYSAIQVDPAEVMRQLWAYLQSYPDAKLGITFDNTATPRRLGEPARVDIERDASGNVVYRDIEVDPSSGLTRVNQDDIHASAWEALRVLGYPLYQDTETGQLVFLVWPNDLAMVTTGLPAQRRTEVTTDATTGDETTTYVWSVPQYNYVEAEPYEIAWWNEIDVGREIENLARETPFDFAETPRWQSDRLAVQQHFAIGYPRLGTKRLDLRFAEDENLLAAVLLRESSSFYASQVIVRGAGEGRLAIRAQVGVPNPNRVRRVVSVTDKTITDRARAIALGNDELRRRLAAYTITEITIDGTHDNAPLGSFTLGDDILVQARMPYYDEVALWHRITAYTWRPDTDSVVLQLRRSEQFAYGRVVTV